MAPSGVAVSVPLPWPPRIPFSYASSASTPVLGSMTSADQERSSGSEVKVVDSYRRRFLFWPVQRSQTIYDSELSWHDTPAESWNSTMDD